MAKEQNPLSLRRTMVKPTIGTVRRTTYDLPDAKNPRHVYGYELPRDPENAGQVISKWVHATPSPAVMSGRSFIETNRQAVVNGYITAGDNRRFANEHPGIVVRPTSKCKGGFVPSNDMTFGIKSKASEDIWGLVQARYTSFENDDADYPDLSSMKSKGKLPLPRETRSSIGRDIRNYPPIRHSEPFKMSKFKGVGPTIYTQPNARNYQQEQYPYHYAHNDNEQEQHQYAHNGNEQEHHQYAHNEEEQHQYAHNEEEQHQYAHNEEGQYHCEEDGHYQ